MDNGSEIISGCLSEKRVDSGNEGRESIASAYAFFSHGEVTNHGVNQHVQYLTFSEYVESLVRDGSISAAENSTFKSYLSVVRLTGYGTADQVTVSIWLAMMLRKGCGYHTLRKYTSFIRRAHEQWSGFAGSVAPILFPDIKHVVSVHSVTAEEISRRKHNLHILKDVSRFRRFPEKERDIWNIFMYTFYTCSSSFLDAIRLRYDNIRTSGHIADLADSSRTHAQRRYVFQLGQGRKRDTQILRETVTGMDTLLRRLGMDFGSGFSALTIQSLWIDAAFECGVPPENVRSIVDKIPPGHSYLTLVPIREIGNEEREEILDKVAEHVCPHNEHWHVMRLRNSVTPDDIKDRAESRNPALFKKLTLYYPTREMVFKENRKIIRREVPYIPRLLFFRIGDDKIVPLFREIGDLAWCYKERNATGSPYSVIPRSDMERFQRYVGKFTPDVQVELADRKSLGIGRRVRITGGLMEGYEGVIHDVADAPDKVSGCRIFQLNLSSDQALRWTVSIEDIYIEPID